MNIYRLTFTAKCVHDNSLVEYAWTVHSGFTIMAEELRRIADGIREGLQEDIANQLFDRFGGQQVLVATHAAGVTIETLRPHVAHWRRFHGLDEEQQT